MAFFKCFSLKLAYSDTIPRSPLGEERRATKQSVIKKIVSQPRAQANAEGVRDGN